MLVERLGQEVRMRKVALARPRCKGVWMERASVEMAKLRSGMDRVLTMLFSGCRDGANRGWCGEEEEIKGDG